MLWRWWGGETFRPMTYDLQPLLPHPRPRPGDGTKHLEAVLTNRHDEELSICLSQDPLVN
jgi:hypothetical protein